MRLFELVTLAEVGIALRDHGDEMIGEHEWHSITIDAQFLLIMPKKMTEIDVKQLENAW
jgi:hypothetical protein